MDENWKIASLQPAWYSREQFFICIYIIYIYLFIIYVYFSAWIFQIVSFNFHISSISNRRDPY